MASTSLSRTPGSSGNRKTWTWSGWIKRAGAFGSKITIFGSFENTDFANYIHLFFTSADKIELQNVSSGSTTGAFTTDRVFRDPSAWFHLLLEVDTTEITASDRIKLYINGQRETNLSSTANPSLNEDLQINISGRSFEIGAFNSNQYFNGLLAHAHFIDGTDYDADTFGETDATTGIWKPKTAPSVTYGTNGFFLKFENSGAFGTDSSGNGNTFTVNGTMTQTIDTPSNVFATWNPLQYGTFTAGSFTMANGNLTFTSNETGSNYPIRYSTLAVSSGKYYAEFKVVSATGFTIGISDGVPNAYLSTTNPNECGYYYDGRRFGFSTTTHDPWGSSFTTNDIIGIAMDLDNNKLYFSKNGTYQESGNPTTGSNGITIPTSATGVYHFAFGDRNSTGQPAVSANFGNGYFGTTAVSSAQNPDDGIGIFEYSVPTGYKALCTKSINAQEYD